MTSFSLAGMTDVVLLLLIFFLLTSSFIPQMGIQVDLPEVDSSAPMEEQSITVAVTDDGTYYVNDAPVAAERLVDALREARATEPFLIVRADQGATIGQFATVASAARALDLRILMATERAGRSD